MIIINSDERTEISVVKGTTLEEFFSAIENIVGDSNEEHVLKYGTGLVDCMTLIFVKE